MDCTEIETDTIVATSKNKLPKDKVTYEIKGTAIKAMSAILFMLNALDWRCESKNHPKYHILINNMSRYSND